MVEQNSQTKHTVLHQSSTCQRRFRRKCRLAFLGFLVFLVAYFFLFSNTQPENHSEFPSNSQLQFRRLTKGYARQRQLREEYEAELIKLRNVLRGKESETISLRSRLEEQSGTMDRLRYEVRHLNQKNKKLNERLAAQDQNNAWLRRDLEIAKKNMDSEAYKFNQCQRALQQERMNQMERDNVKNFQSSQQGRKEEANECQGVGSWSSCISDCWNKGFNDIWRCQNQCTKKAGWKDCFQNMLKTGNWRRATNGL